MSLRITWILSLTVGCMPIKNQSQVKIIGGTEVTKDLDQRTLRSTVRLEYIGLGPNNPPGTCTGTVIGPNHIVTAAHCIRSTRLPDIHTPLDQRTLVALGAQVHPQWGKVPNFGFDVAVLTFKDETSSVVNEVISPVSVGNSANINADKDVILAGYGVVDHAGSSENHLYQVQTKIRVVDPEAVTFDIVSGSGKGPCYGDSGGPAYIDEEGVLQVIGVTSNKKQVSCDLGDGTYIDLSRLRDWLKEAYHALGYPLEV